MRCSWPSSSSGIRRAQRQLRSRRPSEALASTTGLSQGWALRSATGLTDSGATISRVGYATSGWYPVTLPSTVLAGLVANSVYQNIYFGTNLKTIPDLTTQNWWYRGEFTAPATAPGQAYWLRFKGISYRAQIWLNGTQLDANAVGTMVAHEYNVTNLIHPGAANALAILVTPPAHGCKDLSFCTVDWNPEAPDMNAGLWGRDAAWRRPGRSRSRDPYVKTVLPLPATNCADLTVYVDAVNATNAPVTTTISRTITKAGYPTISVSQTVTLNANERREVVFDPAAYPQLHVTNPALWWPYQFGSPELYQLAMTRDGEWHHLGHEVDQLRHPPVHRLSHRRSTEPRSPATRSTVRTSCSAAAATSGTCSSAGTPSTNTAHMQYVKAWASTPIRLEGTLGNEELYDLADKAGVMIMPGFVCCSTWESDADWNAEQQQVANASLDSQMRALRAHASPFVWAFGSDQPPNAAHLATYKSTATALHWQNPTLDNVATWANANAGVKMDGPYKWEPPRPVVGHEQGRQRLRHHRGGGHRVARPRWRACSSSSARRTCGRSGPSGTTTPASRRASSTTSPSSRTRSTPLRHGDGRGRLLEQVRASELREHPLVLRGVELPRVHAVVRCDLLDAEQRVAVGPLEPLRLLLQAGGRLLRDEEGQRAGAHRLRLLRRRRCSSSTRRSLLGATSRRPRPSTTFPDLSVASTTQATLNVPANASTPALTIPAVTGLSTTYFIRLQLKDSSGAVVSSNLYWYSTTPDALANKSNWYMTATKTYANLTGLNTLATNPGVTALVTRSVAAGTETATVTLRNTSTTNVAFFVHPEITAGNGGNEVLPVNYSDNYISLWPGESSTITATYQTSDLGGQPPYLRVRGYNVPATSTALP